MATNPYQSPPSLAAHARPTRVRNLVLGLACGISLLLYLHRYTWGMIKGSVASEFGWETDTLGFLDGLFALAYGLAQIPSGMLCDWFGARTVLGVTIILWSLALEGVAIAGGLTSMAIARVLFGVAQAGCYPTLNKVSKNWFPLTTRTTAQGWIATFFGRGGGALSFILFGTIMLGWLAMPWRTAISVLALVGVVCGVAFYLMFRNTPREHPWVNEAEAELIVAGDPHAAHAARSRLDWRAMAGSVSIWFLFLRGFASNMADVVYVYWVPLYLQQEKGLDFKQTGWLAALPLIGGALGGLASGRLQTALAQRKVSRRWVRSGVALVGKLLAAALMILSLAFESPFVVLAIFLAVKFFSDAEQPAEWGAISDIAGRSAATVFACVNTVGAIGGFLASLLIGEILKAYQVDGQIATAGWTTVFIVIAAEYVIAGLAWLWIDSRRALDGTVVGH